MKYATYNKLKPSAIPWLGDVPADWVVSRLKYTALRIDSGGTPETGDSSYWTTADDRNAIPWVSIGDMTQSTIVRKTERQITEKAVQSKRLRILPRGTLLYSIYASIGKVATLGVAATVNQAILGIVPNESKSNQNFLRFWLIQMEQHLELFSSSNTQDNLNAC